MDTKAAAAASAQAQRNKFFRSLAGSVTELLAKYSHGIVSIVFAQLSVHHPEHRPAQ